MVLACTSTASPCDTSEVCDDIGGVSGFTGTIIVEGLTRLEWNTDSEGASFIGYQVARCATSDPASCIPIEVRYRVGSCGTSQAYALTDEAEVTPDHYQLSIFKADGSTECPTSAVPAP